MKHHNCKQNSKCSWIATRSCEWKWFTEYNNYNHHHAQHDIYSVIISDSKP